MGMIYDGNDPDWGSYDSFVALDYTQEVWTNQGVNPAMGYKFFVRFGENEWQGDDTLLSKRNY